MNIRGILAWCTPFVLAGFVESATPVEAAPSIWFQWDRSDAAPPGPSNLDWDGPTTIHGALVGTGFIGTVRGLSVDLLLRSREPNYPDAWRFDPSGCQADRLGVRFGTTARGRSPMLGPRATTIHTVTYQADPYTPRVRLALEALFDGLVVHPETTYVLAELDFDLTSAVAGPSMDDRCGCANQILELVVVRSTFLNQDGEELPMGIDPWCRSWNDFNNSLTCHTDECSDPADCVPPTSCTLPVPARAATWGSLKDAYRARAR